MKSLWLFTSECKLVDVGKANIIDIEEINKEEDLYQVSALGGMFYACLYRGTKDNCAIIQDAIGKLLGAADVSSTP